MKHYQSIFFRIKNSGVLWQEASFTLEDDFVCVYLKGSYVANWYKLDDVDIEIRGEEEGE